MIHSNNQRELRIHALRAALELGRFRIDNSRDEPIRDEALASNQVLDDAEAFYGFLSASAPQNEPPSNRDEGGEPPDETLSQ